MTKILQSKRAQAVGVGVLFANFVAAVLIQCGVELHPNVVATGAPLLAAITNIMVSKYLS